MDATGLWCLITSCSWELFTRSIIMSGILWVWLFGQWSSTHMLLTWRCITDNRWLGLWQIIITVTPHNFMMISWHGTAFHITGPFVKGINQSVVDSLHKGASNVEFWCFFVASLNKLFNQQSSCCWFETPWWPSAVTVNAYGLWCILFRHGWIILFHRRLNHVPYIPWNMQKAFLVLFWLYDF